MAAVMALKPRSYVMRPRQYVPDKPTADEPRDHRVPVVQPPRLTLEEVRAINRPGIIDPRVRPADRWLERWGATHGGSRVHEPLMARLSFLPRSYDGQVLPLDDHESLLVDAVIATSPHWAQAFVILWYRSDLTTRDIAEVFKIKRQREVREFEHPLRLAYYLGRFAEIGLNVPTLLDVVS